MSHECRICRINVGYRKRIDSDTEDKLLKGISMDKEQAQAIIKNTFESSLDKSGFTGFIKTFLTELMTHPYIPGELHTRSVLGNVLSI